jgi:hypothetical protein
MIAGGAGILLILSLFLEWYNVSAKTAFVDASQGVSGWEALGFIDILLFLIGAIAVAIAITKALNVLPKQLPASPGLILLGLGGLALLLVLFRLLSIPDNGAGSIPGVDVGRSFGVFVALLAAAGVTVGGWLSWNEEGKPSPGGVSGTPLGAGQGYGGMPQQPQQQAYTPPAGGAAAPAAAAPAAQSAPAAAGGAAKADWYPDPRGEKRLRYWDGSQWTDHTAD